VPSSKSQSSQSVQNTTQQYDERVAATDSAIVLQQKDGSQLTFNVTDAEAVELALSFAGDVAATSAKFAAAESAASRELVKASLASEARQTSSEVVQAILVVVALAGAAYAAPAIIKALR
jgi:hypothetical protein